MGTLYLEPGWVIPYEGENLIWFLQVDFIHRCTQEPVKYLRLIFLKTYLSFNPCTHEIATDILFLHIEFLTFYSKLSTLLSKITVLYFTLFLTFLLVSFWTLPRLSRLNTFFKGVLNSFILYLQSNHPSFSFLGTIGFDTRLFSRNEWT